MAAGSQKMSETSITETLTMLGDCWRCVFMCTGLSETGGGVIVNAFHFTPTGVDLQTT